MNLMRRPGFGDSTVCQSMSVLASNALILSRKVRRRWACNKFLRQTFHEFALHSIRQSAWAKAYYNMMCKQRGLKHHAAVRALAFKWIRILYRCWKTRTPYNEDRYYAQLYKKQSPLLKFLESA